jgi:hypothetical protein
MADPNQPGAETNPADAEGKTGLQGGYGSDTGFASDEAQGTSGQVSGEGGTDAAISDDERRVTSGSRVVEDPSAVSDSDTSSGDGQGGSASGREPPTRFDAVPAGSGAAGLAADVTSSAGGVLGAGAQSGGHSTQPGTMAKRTATDDVEDAGHYDRGEAHMGNDRDPKQNTGHPNNQHQKGAF